MGNDKHEELSSTSGRWSDGRLRLGAVGAIIGGVLLAINTVWQGYLDLTPGGDAFLHESTHPASYINDGMLFVAACGLLFGLLALNNHVTSMNMGYMWRFGFFLSVLGEGLFTLGSAGFVLHYLLDFSTFLDVMTIGSGIGIIVMYLGALPLGLVLLRRKVIPQSGALLFLLTVPAVAASMFVVYNMNALVGGLLMGVVYGGAWVITGFYLWGLR